MAAAEVEHGVGGRDLGIRMGGGGYKEQDQESRREDERKRPLHGFSVIVWRGRRSIGRMKARRVPEHWVGRGGKKEKGKRWNPVDCKHTVRYHKTARQAC